jgi:hypothetical protein
MSLFQPGTLADVVQDLDAFLMPYAVAAARSGNGA